MKQIPILLLLLASLCANAQITTIDIVGGLNHSYRILTTDPTISVGLEKLNESNKGKINYLAGFNLTKKISEKLDFKTGIRYTEVGYYEFKNQDLYFGGAFVEEDLNQPLNGSFSTIVKYIEVPIAGRFKPTVDKKLKPFFELGLIINTYLNETSNFQIGGKDSITTTRDSNYPGINTTLMASIGAEYKFDRITAFTQIVNKTGIQPINPNGIYKQRHFENGIEFGIRYNLNSNRSL